MSPDTYRNARILLELLEVIYIQCKSVFNWLNSGVNKVGRSIKFIQMISGITSPPPIQSYTEMSVGLANGHSK